MAGGIDARRAEGEGMMDRVCKPGDCSSCYSRCSHRDKLDTPEYRIADLKAALAAERGRAEALEDECIHLRATNDAEQRRADAALARAEKAEAAYESERANRLRTIAAMERHSDGAWRWIGDGSDDLDSMGADMAVLVSAKDLRVLLAAARADAVRGFATEYNQEITARSADGFTRCRPLTEWAEAYLARKEPTDD
jgi:hypothetical protein